MAPKKTKQPTTKRANVFFVLHDTENSRHLVVSRENLVNGKKENLTVGISATFSEEGDRSSRCRGLIIMSGTKEQCENSVSLIEKSNRSASQLDGVDAGSSNNQIITGRNDSSEEDECQSSNEDETFTDKKACQRIDSIVKNVSPAAPTPKTVSKQSKSKNVSSALPLTTLTDITNNSSVTQKRKDPPEELMSSTKKVKGPTTVSVLMYERLKKENTQLRKENDTYKSNWMPRPTGAAAAYIVEAGKFLSGVSSEENPDEDKGEKLENICTLLKMTENELKLCEHETDITKTCRMITKHIYPDANERAKMLVSSMEVDRLNAIQEYARMVHPAQCKIPNSLLNNAIGNVFSSEKRKLERREMEKYLPAEMDPYQEED